MKKLYILKEKDTNNYKIGYTKNSIDSRIKSLQTGNSNEIIEYASFESDYAIKIETALHNLHSIYNKRGEWFEFTEDEISEIVKFITRLHSNFQFLQHNTI